jgi:hypothetical protein
LLKASQADLQKDPRPAFRKPRRLSVNRPLNREPHRVGIENGGQVLPVRHL